MPTLKEMRDKQATIVAEARERLDQIDKADEARAKELETQHDVAMAEYDALEKKITREEALIALEKRAEEQRVKMRPGKEAIEGRGQDEPEKIEYRAAFYKMLAAGGDVSELAPEERAVLRAGVQKDAQFRAQSIGTTTAGGYTVPTELANEIIKSMKAYGPMYDPGVSTEMVTSSGNPIKIPTIDDTGVTAVAHTENTALTDDGSKDVTFGQKSLGAFGFDTEFIKWSWELTQDSIFNIEALLGSLLGERLGRIANAKLTTGAGTTEPFGVATRSTLGVTAAATAAITFDELMDLVHSVDPAYRLGPKVRFMLHDQTLKAVRKLKNGDGDYIWSMGNVAAGVPGTLLNYPYSINQAMDTLAAAKKVVLFGDLGKYYVRKVGAPVIGVMRERFWPDLGIAGLIRLDGELGDTAAVKNLTTHA